MQASISFHLPPERTLLYSASVTIKKQAGKYDVDLQPQLSDIDPEIDRIDKLVREALENVANKLNLS